jgi:hypothetical protein
MPIRRLYKQVVYINQMQTPQPVVVSQPGACTSTDQLDGAGEIPLYMVAVAGLFLRLLLIVVQSFLRGLKTGRGQKLAGYLLFREMKSYATGRSLITFF